MMTIIVLHSYRIYIYFIVNKNLFIRALETRRYVSLGRAFLSCFELSTNIIDIRGQCTYFDTFRYILYSKIHCRTKMKYVN